MADIYLKTGVQEKCLVLGQRQGCLYAFDFGNNWKKIRIGAMVSVTTGNVLNGYSSIYGIANQNIINVNSNRDRFYFGVKNNNSIFPYEGGSSFIGTTSINECVYQDSYGAYGGGEGFLFAGERVLHEAGTYRYYFVSTSGQNQLGVCGSKEGSKVVLNDTLLSGKWDNQNTHCHIVLAQEISINEDQTSGTVRYIHPYVELNKEPSENWLYGSTVNANFISNGYVSGSATEIACTFPIANVPDAMFLYLPLANMRLRVHAIGAYKIE